MRLVVTVLVAAALVAGCSSSAETHDAAGNASTSPVVVDGITVEPASSPPPPPKANVPAACPAALRRTVLENSKGARVQPSAQASADLLACTYHVRTTSASVCTKVAVQLNSTPTAFWTFQRWTVEIGQNSMWSHNPKLAPRPVAGLGVEAEWVPAFTTFETATLNKWVAVFLTCAHPSNRYEKYARSLATSALHAIH